MEVGNGRWIVIAMRSRFGRWLAARAASRSQRIWCGPVTSPAIGKSARDESLEVVAIGEELILSVIDGNAMK